MMDDYDGWLLAFGGLLPQMNKLHCEMLKTYARHRNKNPKFMEQFKKTRDLTTSVLFTMNSLIKDAEDA